MQNGETEYQGNAIQTTLTGDNGFKTAEARNAKANGGHLVHTGVAGKGKGENNANLNKDGALTSGTDGQSTASSDASSSRVTEATGQVDVDEGSGESEAASGEWKHGAAANTAEAKWKVSVTKAASSEMVSVQGGSGDSQSGTAEGVRSSGTWEQSSALVISSTPGATTLENVSDGRVADKEGQITEGLSSWEGKRKGTLQKCTVEGRSACHELADCVHHTGQCVCKPGYHGDGYSICMLVIFDNLLRLGCICAKCYLGWKKSKLASNYSRRIHPVGVRQRAVEGTAGVELPSGPLAVLSYLQYHTTNNEHSWT